MAGPERQGVPGSGIDALILILRFHELALDPGQIRHQFAGAPFGIAEILRCAKDLKLKARAVVADWGRLAKVPLPALAEGRDGGFLVLARLVHDKALIQHPALRPPHLPTL